MDKSILNPLSSDTRNIWNSLHLELIWKRGRLKEKHWYIANLVENGERCRQLAGEDMIDLCEHASGELGETPTILDVGCGPISSYSYLAHAGIAELTGVDPIASGYAQLFAEFDLEVPGTQLDGTGETLLDQFGREAFDIVTSRNALDHHLSPALAWLNMFRVTKVGGYLCHSHSIREATKEQWKQLHQYDLFPSRDGKEMFIEDGSGTVLSLTAGLPISHIKSNINRNEDGTGWFSVFYQKTGTSEPQDLVAGVLEQTARVLDRRHNWAIKLEEALDGVNATLDSAPTPEPQPS